MKKIYSIDVFIYSIFHLDLNCCLVFARIIGDEFKPDKIPLDKHFSFAFAFCIRAMLSAIGAGVAMIADNVKAG